MDSNIPNLNLNINLSLEQKFQMRIFQESVQVMNPDEARSLLIEASKLLMVKDNIIKGLIKQDLAS
ncbi:MAG: NblA/ycf18 family protein [Pleurocapsa sp.]